MSAPVVVVAGGSGTLGSRVVERVLDAGLRALVLDRTEPSLTGSGISHVSTDLTNQSEVDDAAERLTAEGDRPVALVNCQGWSPKNAGGLPVPDTELTSEDFVDVLRVNLVSCFLTMRAFVPLLARHGGGRVVNVASTAGRTGRTTASPAYAAAKAAIEALTRNFAVRYGPEGVLVCAVAPGKFVNPAWPDNPDAVAGYRAEIPLGRLATADEVADVIGWLASERNSYLTGQTIVVDGGRLA